MENEVVRDENDIFTLVDSAMPGVIESFGTFGLSDIPPKAGDLVLARFRGGLMVRQLGYGSLRASTTEIEDIDLDDVEIISKIQIYEKGTI